MNQYSYYLLTGKVCTKKTGSFMNVVAALHEAAETSKTRDLHIQVLDCNLPTTLLSYERAIEVAEKAAREANPDAVADTLLRQQLLTFDSHRFVHARHGSPS